MVIYGIVASELETFVGGSVLPDPLASADFVNDIYSFGGSPLTVNDVIDLPTSEFVGADGLHCFGGLDPFIVLNDFRDLIFTHNWTMVFEVNVQASANLEFVMVNAGSESITNTYEFWVRAFNGWEGADTNDDDPNRIINNFVDGLTDGYHKVGVTRTDAAIALSVDGSAPDEGEGSKIVQALSLIVGVNHAEITLGSWRNAGFLTPIQHSFYIRSLQIYDPVADGVLQLLTSDVSAGTPAKIINHLNTGARSTATSATTMTLNLPINRTVGNMLIAATTIVTAKAPVWPAGWTAIGAGFAAWRCVDGTETVGPAVTWTGASTESGYIFQWIGTASTISNTTNSQGSGTPATTAAITTTQAKSEAVAIIVCNANLSVSVPAGFQNVTNPTASGTPATAIRVAHAFIETSGTTSPSVSSTISGGGNTWKAVLIELKVA